MADRDKYIKELEAEMKKYKGEIKKIEASIKDPALKGKDKLLAEAKDLKSKLHVTEDILNKLKKASPGNFEDLKAVTAALVGHVKETVQGYSNQLSMDPVYRAKDDISEFSCEKISQVEDYIKEKPLVSAACALGIGFLLGTLFKRSK